MAHAQRAIVQQRVNDLAAAEANGTLTPAQKRELERFREILATSPYGTELPKGPPPGFDPHATNPAHREWHPPDGKKPAHPANDKFTPEALALSDDEIAANMKRMRAEGHAADRHSADLREGQLSDRSVWGADPITQTREDGVHQEDHGYSRHATQFTSDRAKVQALKAVEASAEYSNSLKEAEEHNAAHPEAPQYQIEVRIPLEDALGPHYENHVRGRSRLGSSKKPTGWEATDLKNGTVFALYRYDESTKTYRLYTMYPDK